MRERDAVGIDDDAAGSHTLKNAGPIDTLYPEETTPVETMQRALDTAHADVARLEVENRALAAKLAAIETSTSWRIMLRIHPIIWFFKAAIRWMRRLRDAVARANPVERHAIDTDLLETCLIPTWNRTRGIWELERDGARLADLRLTKTAPGHSVAPYVIKPVVPVDPGKTRPLVMHIIANVHVGGSTQLIIDLLENLADRYDQEVVTSALWSAGPHTGMVTHLFPAPLDVQKLSGLLARRKPAIVHIHYWGLVDEQWYRAAMQAVTTIPCKVVENINTPIAPYIHARVDHYIYVSEYVRQEFGTGADDPAHSSVIHPGINLTMFDQPIDLDETANTIGMVYRLETDKLRKDSIQLFIEVVRRRPRTKVYIVGGGSLFRSYIAQVKEAGVRQNFHFTGYVPYETLPGWYSRFGIFVAPVQKESFGQVSVFAMNMKMAVAGYEIGALPEILDYRDTLGGDTATAVEKIVALLDDPERRRMLGERNRARAQAAFGVEAMTARYGEIYDRLLAD